MDSPVWFITGASSGFGLLMAKEALARGHKVIAAARNPAKIDNLAALGATVVTLDVTSPEEEIKSVVDASHAIHGRLTHIVNAAGYILDGAVEEATADDVRRLYETNVVGVHKVCRAVTPYLRAQGHGYIINFGSIGSWAGHAACAHYCATKWAVSGFTEGLALELEHFGVRAIIVELGYFRTGFLNDGARTSPATKIDAYKTGPTGDLMKLLDDFNNNQPGDPLKGSKILVDLLTGTGVGEGRELPGRVVLGSDVVATIRKKCADTLALVDEWEAVALSTDFPKGT